MPRRSLISLLTVILLIVIGFIIYSQYQKSTLKVLGHALFKCDDNKTIEATFYEDDVRLTLNQKQKLDLPRAFSASGVRFANEDESFVFWNKGSGAFIQENGQMTFRNCITTD